MTVAQTIVSDVVTLRERGKYQGILVRSLYPRSQLVAYVKVKGAVVGLANGIGPIIGAVLASQSRDSWFDSSTICIDSWQTLCRRWIFRLNLPLAAISSLSVVFFMPLKKVHGHWKT